MALNPLSNLLIYRETDTDLTEYTVVGILPEGVPTTYTFSYSALATSTSFNGTFARNIDSYNLDIFTTTLTDFTVHARYTLGITNSEILSRRFDMSSLELQPILNLVNFIDTERVGSSITFKGMLKLRNIFMNYNLIIIDAAENFRTIDLDINEDEYILTNLQENVQHSYEMYAYTDDGIILGCLGETDEYVPTIIRPHEREILNALAAEANIVGFEEISLLELQNIFDSLDIERTVNVVKSNAVEGRWYIELPKHYLPDVDTIKENDYFSYMNYVKDGNYFNLDSSVSLDSPQQIVALFANKYDVLSEVWARRAANRHNYIDTRTSGAALRLEQEFNHCIRMRDYYKNLIVRKMKW